MTIYSPYIRTDKTSTERARDWLVAIIPVMIWSIYMFGARVATISTISALVCLLLDYPVQRFVYKMQAGARFDLMAAIYGILAVFMMPVTVPLWMPAVSAVLVVIAKNIRVFRGKRLFNPFVFSAAVLNLIFPAQMTAFTRPLAYFSATEITIDPKLISGYRVLSPLQYIADGSVYEDGVYAQLYGYASGCIGEIAVAAIILSLIWLLIRKEADIKSTAAFLVPILILALLYPSDDAESNFYAYSILLSGGIAFLSVFAINERCTVPLTGMGRIVFAAICGAAVFAARKYYGGYEWGYLIILVMNIASPFIEMATKPKILDKKQSPQT